MLEGKQGTLWVATAQGWRHSITAPEASRRYPTFQDPPLDRIYEDRSGTLWVGSTRAGGVASLDPKTGLLTRYAWFDEKTRSARAGWCYAIHEDRYGMLWLATRPDGLVKFDRQRGQFTRYLHDPGRPDSLNSSLANSLAEDNEGGIWVGTSLAGVNRFSGEPSPFTVYREESGNPNSLNRSYVYSVFEDSQEILWIATPYLNRLDRNTGRYTFYRNDRADATSIHNWPIFGITEDRSGFLWFGSWGGGLYRFDRKSGRFKAYRHNLADPGSLSSDVIWTLYTDRAGALWVGTDDGANRFDPRTERFTVYRDSQDPPPSRIYRAIAEDADGSIWLGTFEWGVQRLDVRTGKIVTYRNDPKLKGSLSNNHVNALCVDKSGQLWVGTQNGLNRYDPHAGEFAIFNEHDGLPANSVLGILEDDAGNLWIATGNGLSKFDPRAKTFKNYNAEDGLAGNDFNDTCVYFKNARGEMFFGGVSGMTAFYPGKVLDSPFVPPIVLTDFRLFNNLVRVGGKSVLRTSISYTDSITLTHEQNIFSIEFSSLSYTAPQRNRYRYMLEGLEKAWNEVGSDQRLVTYTTLPPGRYTFRAQGSSSSGVWNVRGVSVAITILPPWYRTIWFLVLSVGAFLALLWAAYQFRVRQLQREFNMAGEARLNERTRIARELHDTLLQSVQGLMFSFQAARNLLPGRTEEAIRTLDGAIREGDEAIAEGRDAIQGLRANPALESNLEHLLTAAGKELARSSSAEGEPPAFQVTVEGARQPLSPLLQDEVYRIAREILRNAFHHAHASRIEAEIAYDRQFFRLRIRDNGKGIDRKVLEEGARQGHWGLPGVRERAKRIGAQLKLWSEPGAGTEAELTVPARIAYGTVHRRAGIAAVS